MAKAVSDEEIIAAILQHGTIKEAAAAAGTSPRVIYDRMKEKDFRNLYRDAKNDIFRAAVFSISSKLGEAVEAVAAIMSNPEVNAAVRLQAAQTILNYAGKFSERLQTEETAAREDRNSIFDLDL